MIATDLSRRDVARVRRYARGRDLTEEQAVGKLLVIALDHLDARSAGGTATNRRLTAAERRRNAKRAIEARWAKHRAAEE